MASRDVGKGLGERSTATTICERDVHLTTLCHAKFSLTSRRPSTYFPSGLAVSLYQVIQQQQVFNSANEVRRIMSNGHRWEWAALVAALVLLLTATASEVQSKGQSQDCSNIYLTGDRVMDATRFYVCKNCCETLNKYPSFSKEEHSGMKCQCTSEKSLKYICAFHLVTRDSERLPHAMVRCAKCCKLHEANFYLSKRNRFCLCSTRKGLQLTDDELGLGDRSISDSSYGTKSLL